MKLFYADNSNDDNTINEVGCFYSVRVFRFLLVVLEILKKHVGSRWWLLCEQTNQGCNDNRYKTTVYVDMKKRMGYLLL